MIGAGSDRPEMTQIQKDRHHILSPLWMLALNLQICSFHSDTYEEISKGPVWKLGKVLKRGGQNTVA